MEGLDLGRVSAWMRSNIADIRVPVSAELIAGGRSNLTFLLRDADGAKMVLRRPPLGHILATAHDMAREHRIITAIGQTNVPVPKTVGLCLDVEVNGAPFYLMQHCDGLVLDSAERAEALAPELRIQASENLVDTLADLHAVDVDQIGLGDLARRDGYIERQVRRWSAQWENSKTRELAAIDEVGRRLQIAIPNQVGVSVAHGDYRFGNCLTNLTTGAIEAVLDWELCTLGDPLADLGYMGVYWSDGSSAVLRDNDATPAGGFMTYRAVVERYARRTGRNVDQIGYYVAFSCWRLAVISEGVYSRYLNGAMGENGLDLRPMKAGTEALAQRALEAMEQLV
jgi:aminoglycoside phosphotransferase (APT) family kinase protein